MRALARIGRSRHAARSLRLPTSRSLAPLAPSLSRGFRAFGGNEAYDTLTRAVNADFKPPAAGLGPVRPSVGDSELVGS